MDRVVHTRARANSPRTIISFTTDRILFQSIGRQTSFDKQKSTPFQRKKTREFVTSLKVWAWLFFSPLRCPAESRGNVDSSKSASDTGTILTHTRRIALVRGCRRTNSPGHIQSEKRRFSAVGMAIGLPARRSIEIIL